MTVLVFTSPMRMARFGRSLVVAAAFLALFAIEAARATQYWELTPVADARVAYGTYTVARGKTSPDGVNFTLKNNTLDNPVQLTLVSTKAGAKLHLSAFKDAGSFLDQDTDANGTLVVRFRTGDDMHFKVSGPLGSTYQIALWRGPAIKLPANDPIVAMDAAQAGGGRPPQAVQPAQAARSVQPAPAAEKSESNTLIYILLAGIFVALIVIAGLIYRGQQLRGKP
jgi:hypothetical protein